MDSDKVFHIFFVFGIQESGRKQSVIIVQYDDVLVGSWLLHWGEPHAVVHQLWKVLVPDLLYCLFLEHFFHDLVVVFLLGTVQLSGGDWEVVALVLEDHWRIWTVEVLLVLSVLRVDPQALNVARQRPVGLLLWWLWWHAFVRWILFLVKLEFKLSVFGNIQIIAFGIPILEERVIILNKYLFLCAQACGCFRVHVHFYWALRRIHFHVVYLERLVVTAMRIFLCWLLRCLRSF